MPPLSPTLVQYAETTWTDGTATKATASMAWQSGDIVVAIIGVENSTATPGTPTVTGLNFSVLQSNTAASTCATKLCVALAQTTSSGTVSSTLAGSSGQNWGMGVWIYRPQVPVAGFYGSSAEQHTSSLSVNVTPKIVNSAFVWGVFDFSAGAVQTIVPTPTNTRQAATVATSYTFYVADLSSQTSRGATAYGISGSGTGPFSIVALEILANGSYAVIKRNANRPLSDSVPRFV